MSNKIKINLAEKEYEVIINFKKSFELSWFRVKMQKSDSLDDVDMDILREIEQLDRTNPDISKLSPKARKYLMKSSKDTYSNITYEDILRATIICLELSEEEVIEILEGEYAISGFDDTIQKIINMISTVFTNVKDASTQAQINKQQLHQVATPKAKKK